jgi:hypothetical protein
MLRKEQINEALNKLGVSESDAQRMIDAGLGKVFDGIADGVMKEAATFTAQVNACCFAARGKEWPQQHPEIFDVVADAMWKDEYSGFMPRHVFDAFVRVARERLLPGTKEGHFRSPTMATTLAGKSGDALQDLMIVLFSDSQKRWKEKHEQSDRGSSSG